MAEHPPWGGGNQHPDFGPPPHGFNGQSPVHMRRPAPAHVSQDDPSLVPNVPYFDLPAGLMAPLVKVHIITYYQLTLWCNPELLIKYLRLILFCPVHFKV